MLMRILVCVKQVPDLESKFRPNADCSSYDEAGLRFRINYYDEFAAEEAIRIKEEVPGSEITVVSVGPARAQEAVRRAMEMGGDHGVLIDDAISPLMPPAKVAGLIAAYARDKNYDLILTGIMAEDDQCCQVGPMLAEMLNLPWASTVVERQLEDDRQSILAVRELEGGIHHTVRLPLPAVLTIQSGINFPRYPSLSNKLRVRKQEVLQIDSSELDIGEDSYEKSSISHPPPAATGEFLTGSMEEIADELIKRLRQQNLI
jgi:electron transfer flavoprotein beta subunit